MYVFLQTCQTGGSQTVTEAVDMAGFCERGRSSFLIPSAIVKRHLEIRVQSLDKKKDEIFQLECTMGVRSDYIIKANPLTIDYDDIARRINSLNADLAWTMHSCKRTKRLLDFMDSVTTRYTTQAATNAIPEDEISEVQALLKNSHAYLHAWNQGLADRVGYLTSRLQALSQSVRLSPRSKIPSGLSWLGLQWHCSARLSQQHQHWGDQRQARGNVTTSRHCHFSRQCSYARHNSRYRSVPARHLYSSEYLRNDTLGPQVWHLELTTPRPSSVRRSSTSEMVSTDACTPGGFGCTSL